MVLALLFNPTSFAVCEPGRGKEKLLIQISLQVWCPPDASALLFCDVPQKPVHDYYEQEGRHTATLADTSA